MLRKIQHFLQKRLSSESQAFIKKRIVPLFSYFFRNNLDKLAIIWKTDKNLSHYYTQHYQRHFEAYRKKRINILEIGVGGYDDPKKGGNSLYMWKSYFPKADIFAIDIHKKAGLERGRIKIFQGSQTDDDFLKRVESKAGGFDIIIDDGSHNNDDVIKSFQILFPLLRQGGLYVVEDLQTSYWPKFGGDSLDRLQAKSSVNYFRDLVHSLNYEEFLVENYQPTYYDKNIVAIHFYHNMVFIEKGDNREGSNLKDKVWAEVNE